VIESDSGSISGGRARLDRSWTDAAVGNYDNSVMPDATGLLTEKASELNASRISPGLA